MTSLRDGAHTPDTPTGAGAEETGSRLARSASVFLLVGGTYFVAARLAQILGTPTGMAVIWPASGVAIAALLSASRRRWPLILLAVAVAHASASLFSPLPMTTWLAFTAIDVAEAVLASYVVRRMAPGHLTMASVREVLAVVIGAAVVANAVTATAAGAVAALTVNAGFLLFGFRWWVSNGTGIILVVPLALSWRASWDDVPSEWYRRVLEAVVLFVTLVLLAAWVFDFPALDEPLGARPFYVFPSLFWAALRFGPAGSSLASLIVAIFGVWGTVHGEGPFVGGLADLDEAAVVTQIFLGIAVLTSLIPAAVVAEQRRMRREAERYRLLSQHARDPILLIRASDLSLVEVNDAAVRLYGYPAEQLRQMTVESLRSAEFHEDISRRLALADPGGTLFETVHVRSDGSKFPVEVSSRALTIDGERLLLAVVRDITDRRRLEAQLLQAQKMEAIGRLAGGVAHDFNNLLTVIQGYTEAVAASLASHDERRQSLEEVLAAAERAASLTRQLLAFGRKQLLRPAVIDLNGVIRDAERMLRRLIGEDIAFVTVLDATLAPVLADPGQLHQVLLNLTVNARDAMPDGGSLTVRTSNVVISDQEAREHEDAQAGRYVLLSVTDTGVGIPAEIQSQVFEPFFTTKPRDRGTGLGLSMVYGIVRQSGGFVTLDSSVGAGTTFGLYLPAAEPQAVVERVKEEPTGIPGSETILLVEDEDLVRSLTERMLRGLGYAVVASSRGSDALALAAKATSPIHLLLTDVVMPEMDGRTLAERIKEVSPRIKVLFMSGYTDELHLASGGLATGSAFISKPFGVGALGAKIREVLDG